MKKLNDRQFDTLFDAMNQLNPQMISDASVSGNPQGPQKKHPARHAALKWVLVAVAAVTIIASLFAVFILNDIAHRIWGQPSETGGATDTAPYSVTEDPITTMTPDITTTPETTEEVTTTAPVTTETPEATEKTETTAKPEEPKQPENESNGLAFVKSEEGAYWIVYGTEKNAASRNVVIPDSFRDLPVREIGDRAFDKYAELQTVEIPDTVLIIGEEAFRSCSSLEFPALPSHLEYIGDRAFGTKRNFRNINVYELALPDSVYHIGKEAFEGYDFFKVTVSKKMEAVDLGDFSFDHMVIPEGVEKVKGEFRGEGVALVEILSPTTIPETVSGHIYFIVHSGSFAEQYAKANGLVYDTYESGNVYFDINGSENPHSVAVYNVANLQLRFIMYGRIEYEGRTDSTSNYEWCWAEWPDGLTVSFSEGLMNIPECFTLSSLRGIRKVEIPSNVQSIDAQAFLHCEDLESATIPPSVTVIEEEAFCGCESLCVTIPKTVTEIGRNAFAGVAEIAVEEGNPRYKVVDNCLIDIREKAVISLGKGGVIPDDGSVTAILGAAGSEDLYVPDSVERIGGSAFVYDYWLPEGFPGSSLKKIVFGKDSRLKVLEDFALQGVNRLPDLPDSLEIIGDHVFLFATFEHLIIPSGVKQIGTFLEWFSQASTVTFLSPDTQILQDVLDEPPDAVYGYPGSTAEAWANRNGLEFRVIAE